MMTVSLAIAAVIGATIAIFVDRNIQARKKAAQIEAVETETATAQAEPQSGNLFQYVTSIRNRLTGNKAEVAKKFQNWAETNIEDAQLKAWLMGLSPEAAGALVEQLADFCFNLGFELEWLLEDTMSRDPEIKQEAVAVVTSYCRACWSAAQSYTDFELFKLLQEVEQAPFTRKHRDLSRRLFGELVNREMAASVPAELFLASEKEREEHMTKAIQQAAETNRDGFKTVLKDVLAAQAQEAPASTNGASQSASSEEKPAEEPEKPRRFSGFGGKGKGASAAASSTEAETQPGSPAVEPSAS